MKCDANIPLLSKEGCLRQQTGWLVIDNYPVRSHLSVASPHLVNGRVHPSFKRRGMRGATTVYFAFFTVMALGFLVMAVDFGRAYVIQGELQTAADAAALSAARQLSGASNVAPNPHDAINSVFDSTTGNDNRFNLRLNQIGSGAAGLISSLEDDYFSALSDAQGNVGGQTTTASAIDWSSGLYSKYVRVQINAQAPVVFAPLLTNVFGSLPTVSVAAIAGLSGPMCTVCGIEGLAVVDMSGGSDPTNYGFTPGLVYTLSLTGGGRIAGTAGIARYVVLDHSPNGPVGLEDVDGALFELGAGTISNAPGLTPAGTIAIDTTETVFPSLPANATVARDLICGLNVRFGVDASNPPCSAVGEFASLQTAFTADTDVNGGANPTMEDYAMEYSGNFRRIITVAIIDTATTLGVVNFRQFLIEPAPPPTQGLAASAVGAFRAQYIGTPVPLRCGGVGGVCSISGSASPGVGRVVLH